MTKTTFRAIAFAALVAFVWIGPEGSFLLAVYAFLFGLVGGTLLNLRPESGEGDAP